MLEKPLARGLPKILFLYCVVEATEAKEAIRHTPIKPWTLSQDPSALAR